MAFIRTKTSRGVHRITTNYYLVENVRAGARIKQRVIAYLGKYESFKHAERQIPKDIKEQQQWIRIIKQNIKNPIRRVTKRQYQERLDGIRRHEQEIKKLRELRKAFRSLSKKYPLEEKRRPAKHAKW